MKRRTAMLAAIAMLAFATMSWACPLCKDAIPSSDAQAPGGVPGGFNTTIYFMLGGLFCVIGLITMTLIRGARGSSASRGGRGFPLS